MSPNAFRLRSLACWCALSLSDCSAGRDTNTFRRDEAAGSGTRSTPVSQPDGRSPAQSDSPATSYDDQLKDGGVDKSCDDVIAAWSELVANAQECQVDSDCHVSPVNCQSGLGVCNVHVNSSFDAELGADLVATVRAQQCRTYPCECHRQTSVECVNGTCSWKPLCGAHDVLDKWTDSLGRECVCDPHRGTVCMLCGEHWQGEQWANSNGCSCVCTNDGETVCSCNALMNDADAG